LVSSSGLGAVLDGQDAGGCEFFDGPVDRVDRAVQPAGEQRPAGHPHPAGVAVSGEVGVEAEGGARDGGVEHPFGDDGEALLDRQLSGLFRRVSVCYSVRGSIRAAF